MRFRPHTFSFAFILTMLVACPMLLDGQTRKKRTVKKPNRKPPVYIAVGRGTASSDTYKPEPYLALEPCAKEDAEQIEELENSSTAAAQVDTLVNRTRSDDKWTRGCAIYRLGTFGSASTDALPVLLRILDDNEDPAIWNLADKAIWSVPPSRGFTVDERIRDAKSPDNNKRIYAVFSLAYFKHVKGSNESKRSLAALIEVLSDKNPTIVYIATRGIQRHGNWGEDTSSAVPALVDLIRSRKTNPLHPLYAMMSMGVHAAPATPLLIEMLTEPTKFFSEGSDSNGIRAYSLRLTTEMVLGEFGPDFVPVLEKYRESHPYSVLGVLSHMSSDESLRLTLDMAKTGDPKIRVKAIQSIPILKPSYAVKVIPTLLRYVNDRDKEIRNAAISKLGLIAQLNKEKPEDFRSLYRKQVVPKFVSLLNDKDSGCSAQLALPRIGDDALSAIPALVRISKKPSESYCATLGLYHFGEAGRKHLTAEQMTEAEQSRSILKVDRDKPKEIKPKDDGKSRKPPDSDTY